MGLVSDCSYWAVWLAGRAAKTRGATLTHPTWASSTAICAPSHPGPINESANISRAAWHEVADSADTF